jgi:hypothetical protein
MYGHRHGNSDNHPMVFRRRRPAPLPSESVTQPILTTGPLRHDATTQAVALAVRPVDPGFDPELFMAEAKRIYDTVRAAWVSADLDSVRGAIDNNLFPRLEARLEQCRQRRILTEAIYPKETTASFIGGTITQDGSEQIRVRFEASGQICDINLTTNQPLTQPQPRRWRESWVFDATQPQRTFEPGPRCPHCHNDIGPQMQACPGCQGSLRTDTKHFKVSRIEVVA